MDQIARAKQLEIVLHRAEQRSANAENAGKSGLGIRGSAPAAVAQSSPGEAELSACSAG